MKKVSIFVISLFYLVSTSGIAWSNFYCCGKLKQTALYSYISVNDVCKGDKKPGCCDTKAYLVKVKDDHSPASQLKFSANDFVSFALPLPVIPSLVLAGETVTSVFLHAPPLIGKLPVYLSLNNFRI